MRRLRPATWMVLLLIVVWSVFFGWGSAYQFQSQRNLQCGVRPDPSDFFSRFYVWGECQAVKDSAGTILAVGLTFLVVGDAVLGWTVWRGQRDGWGRRSAPAQPTATPASAPAVFVPCPGCGRTVNRQVGHCPYCQTQVEGAELLTGGERRWRAASAFLIGTPKGACRQVGRPDVGLRSSPLSGEVVARLASGDEVVERDRLGPMARVTTAAGVTGWIQASALSEKPSPGGGAQPAGDGEGGGDG